MFLPFAHRLGGIQARRLIVFVLMTQIVDTLAFTLQAVQGSGFKPQVLPIISPKSPDEI